MVTIAAFVASADSVVAVGAADVFAVAFLICSLLVADLCFLSPTCRSKTH